jgi:hypothetical protein
MMATRQVIPPSRRTGSALPIAMTRAASCASVAAVVVSIVACPVRTLDAQLASSTGALPAAAVRKPVFPIRVLDRPTTLPAGALRVDGFLLGSAVPGSSFATTAILGGGWGLTSTLEVGGQLVPVALSPELQYTNPSLYITYGHSLDASTSLAPTLQVVFPLRSGDPFTIDVGAALSVDIGAWGEVETAPTFSINLHQDGNGTSLSLPLTVTRQESTRFNWQLSTGVGVSRFAPRFWLSRRSDALDFNDVTVPASAQVMYTVPRDASADALVDIALQGQFPQLYTNRPDLRGWQTNDWTVQLQTSWYVVRTPRTAAPETAASTRR